MKSDLYALLSRGVRSVLVEGTFVHRGWRGHALLRDIRIPNGEEDHVWLNWRAYVSIPDFEQLRPGDRIRFIADLQGFRKRNGEHSVRLECVRELRRVSGGEQA